MKESHLALEGDDLVVELKQDAQDIVDTAKYLREQPQHGDFHHRWSIPDTLVVDFYNQYCGMKGNVAVGRARPMDKEFWEWVNKKMKDPAYKIFWTYDPANPGWLGYARTRS